MAFIKHFILENLYQIVYQTFLVGNIHATVGFEAVNAEREHEHSSFKAKFFGEFGSEKITV